MKQFLPRQKFSSNFFTPKKLMFHVPQQCLDDVFPAKVNKTNRASYFKKWSSDMKRVFEASAYEIQTRDCNLKL